MGRIAEESIQQVIAACDIVELIGEYFPLKRAGTSYKARCPFHNERTPSFHVNPSRNTYHCFGCGKGGNAIGFVMEYENLSFVETVRKLAAKYGITLIEEASSPGEEAAAGARTKLLALHRDIAQWFHMLLLRSSLAAEAREYLKSRGFNSETAKRWLIGYAPEDMALYAAWAKESGYSQELLTAAGILSLRDENNPARGVYVRFRHRLMFPVRNDHGDVIAFSGRVLKAEDSPAKYMNSPATPIFDKSEVFFGFDKSKRAVHRAQSVVICEGQLDMIRCFESGIENIVAPLGTAFTAKHARLLKRHTDQAVLCYDSDPAGVKAAARAFAELAGEGVFVRVAALPPGEDPDSLIRKEGVEALRERLENAKDFFDFQIDRGLAEAKPGDLRDRMRLLRELTGHLALLTDRVVLDGAIHRTALRLNTPPDELRRMVAAHLKQRARFQSASRANQEEDNAGDDANASAVPEEPLNLALRMLLRLALTDADARAVLLREEPSWREARGAHLLERVLSARIDPADPHSVNVWLATLEPAEQAVFTALLHERPVGGDPVETATQLITSLELQTKRSRLSLLQARLRQGNPPAETLAVTFEEIKRLIKDCEELQKRLLPEPGL